MEIDTFGAFGGDDKVVFDAAFLWGVVGDAEAEIEPIELVLELGVVDVAINPQFTGFALDFAVCAHLDTARIRPGGQ